jgi:hypothetical protein
MTAVSQRTVYIVSDLTGSTGYQMLRAVLARFDPDAAFIKTYPAVNSVSDMEGIAYAAKATNALIAYTFALPAMRSALRELCDRENVEAIDLLGPLELHLSRWLGSEPDWGISASSTLDDDYYERVLALDFALRHDDGRNLQGLLRADVILAGVSRTSKTPLSVYLAYRGIRAANVPLMPELDPPEELMQMPPERVIGLTLRATRLQHLRQQRHLGFDGEYTDVQSIREELAYAEDLFEREGWRSIDMTYRTIEEAGTTIMTMLQENRSTGR